MKKENAGNRGSGVSGSRRTRSQIAVAPGWTAADCLVLVNVIAAVEADCLKALSSYQKWKIVAENCTSLDVVRTSNQCRRKWDCLLIEHDVIKQWELKMPDDDSYWRLASGRRKELGLPENFDEELFKAIDNVASMRANQSDTEPDSDPEAAIENANEIAEPGMGQFELSILLVLTCIMLDLIRWDFLSGLFWHPNFLMGPKRQRRRSMSKSNQALENSPECERNQALEISLECKEVEDGGEGEGEEVKEKPLLSSPELESQEYYIKSNESKVADDVEPKEQMMAKFLLENAEKVQAIVSENAEYTTSDEKCNKDQTNLVRHQGSKLIRCLGDILNTINDLRGLLKDCD
ncbi:trihelix transcription factor ASR3 [Cucumis melo var. makuwa]|uniref:Trihelix transcription factor ASR3 n=1 Tax=Cucumis melo var. makuwa TaxID=1194695 RepID=A0A5A7T5I6_CUCMM|nr:trihelix transcription factor ASR3 [Cucumis melo var. makuwa]TYK31347.1 trihelix transcription factor ASR3 [Cucumis melo var. makuwa]